MKRIFNNNLNIIILAILFGALGGGVVSSNLFIEKTKSNQDLIKEFYEVENAVYVSPHHIRKHIEQGDKDFILIDLRSQQEYETAHIIGALNVPVYVSPDKSAYEDIDRIVNEFRKIQEEYINKTIIIYCYSAPCMSGRKIGKMLTEHDIYVKHLGIGWQEWRYYWNLWNHDGETPVNPANYIKNGSEPGVFYISREDISGCVLGGDFGC